MGNEPEIVRVWNRAGEFVGPMPRPEYYRRATAEYLACGRVELLIEVVWIMLTTRFGRAIVQERAEDKEQNATLLDKSVGGHMTHGLPENILLMCEAAQEAGVPLGIVENQVFLDHRYSDTLDMRTTGIATKVDRIFGHDSVRIFHDGSQVVIPQVVHVYAGRWDGPFLFTDGESSGMLARSRAQLLRMAAETPEVFTSDLLFLIEHYIDWITGPGYKA